MKALEILTEKILSCTKCQTLSSRIQVVPSSGSKSDLFIIGEAPGEKEDQDGIPFIGKAGQLLINVLSLFGWNRDNVFITNVIKCRPPYNRVPLPEEIDNCATFLDYQLKVIKPKVVVLLGNIALRRFFPDKSVTQTRGTWDKITEPIEAEVFVTFHPSYIIRNILEKEAWIEDWYTLSKQIGAT